MSLTNTFTTKDQADQLFLSKNDFSEYSIKMDQIKSNLENFEKQLAIVQEFKSSFETKDNLEKTYISLADFDVFKDKISDYKKQVTDINERIEWSKTVYDATERSIQIKLEAFAKQLNFVKQEDTNIKSYLDSVSRNVTVPQFVLQSDFEKVDNKVNTFTGSIDRLDSRLHNVESDLALKSVELCVGDHCMTQTDFQSLKTLATSFKQIYQSDQESVAALKKSLSNEAAELNRLQESVCKVKKLMLEQSSLTNSRQTWLRQRRMQWLWPKSSTRNTILLLKGSQIVTKNYRTHWMRRWK